MILSCVDIERSLKAKRIRFDPPVNKEQIGQASIDLRLGNVFTKWKKLEGVQISVAHGLGDIGDLGLWNDLKLEEFDSFGKRNTFVISPGEFILALTHESVSVPRDLIARVEGRSTYARVGLSMHQTAPWIQPGWSGRIVLEMMNNGPNPIALTPGIDRPCQISFMALKTAVPQRAAYGSLSSDIYKDQVHPLRHRRK